MFLQLRRSHVCAATSPWHCSTSAARNDTCPSNSWDTKHPRGPSTVSTPRTVSMSGTICSTVSGRACTATTCYASQSYDYARSLCPNHASARHDASAMTMGDPRLQNVGASPFIPAPTGGLPGTQPRSTLTTIFMTLMHVF